MAGEFVCRDFVDDFPISIKAFQRKELVCHVFLIELDRHFGAVCRPYGEDGRISLYLAGVSVDHAALVACDFDPVFSKGGGCGEEERRGERCSGQ